MKIQFRPWKVKILFTLLVASFKLINSDLFICFEPWILGTIICFLCLRRPKLGIWSLVVHGSFGMMYVIFFARNSENLVIWFLEYKAWKQEIYLISQFALLTTVSIHLYKLVFIFADCRCPSWLPSSQF